MSQPVYIDINCDMGESYGRWTLGHDEEVMPNITSANGKRCCHIETTSAPAEGRVRSFRHLYRLTPRYKQQAVKNY